MKILLNSIACMCMLIIVVGLTYAQEDREETEKIHHDVLTLDRKQKEVFGSRDSILILTIDTLIMGDRSSLHFYGKKKVILNVVHAEIGKRVYITGVSNKNNASDFDIEIHFAQLGSMYIMANGHDALNGSRTDPNGDGGHVRLRYSEEGVVPQMRNRRQNNFLYVDVSAGGRHVNPTADVQRIYSQILNSGYRMSGVPQGQIYSGSMGREGSLDIASKSRLEDQEKERRK